MGAQTFDVFQKGAIHGIDGLERFLPSPSIKGEAGMDAYLEKEFSGTDLISHFKQNSKNPIKAIISLLEVWVELDINLIQIWILVSL